MSTRAIFRVDASVQIGTGHVMRCLTLANELAEQGVECHFICREHPGHLIPLVAEHGHQLHVLPCAATTDDLSKGLGETQATDACQSIAIIQNLLPEWLIVDHYALDYHWQTLLRPYCKKIMVIDDLADRQHECDLLLDQTYGRDQQDYKPLVPAQCELLCGSQYALLRPEFSQWRQYSLERRQQGKLQHLLINLGGVDKDNITSQILNALQGCPLPNDCKITVVMGSTAPWVDVVKQQARQLPWITEVKVGVENMAELMANSDLAIGAAGATSWERCCLGLPTIMVILAENQRVIAENLNRAKAGKRVYIESINEDLSKVFINLSNDAMKQISYHATRICDGLGRVKIARLISGR
ncbi:UDP-2,4-diacetamido-2,4,6-trideoxy-beta-L-altropyranose hydrolase [Nitrincola lacisaponensis]|nr:UDP-2,4-diacetamido-2,4,6-trideoxy-beta-L-altropyranose hydrolase [Nitrincola lacisaponensis]